MAQLTNEERIEVNDGREMKVLMIVGSLRRTRSTSSLRQWRSRSSATARR